MSLSEQLKQSLSFKSLRGRYIYIAIAIFVLVSLVVIFAEKKVEKAAEEYQQEFSDQFLVKNEIENFISKNENMKSMLLEYLILPEKLHSDLLENSIVEYDESFVRLENILEEKSLIEDDGFNRVMEELRQDVKPMNDMVEKISQVRSDAEANFPFTKIMLEDLTENNNVLLGAIYDAIENPYSGNSTRQNELISNHFRDIRYYWVRITTEYRLMVTIRFGVFVGDWKSAYSQIRSNVDQYKNVVASNIDSLEALDKKGLLSFESSESLGVIRELVSKSFRSYDEAMDLIESSAWRVDILLWESRVEPGFDKVNSTINALRSELQKYQLETMSGLGEVSGRLSLSLWLIIGAGIVITVVGYLLFDRHILRPIAFVTGALVKQSQGQDVIMPVHSSTREISDLVNSYTEMYKEVELSKSNLEDLVNERTSSLESSKLKLEGTLESLRKTKQSELEAEKANEAKTLFLANMSHEIRTPMNVILGYTQIMQHETGLTESQSTALSAIKRSANHLLMLINNILDISKIEAGKIELQPVDFNLNTFLNDLYVMFKGKSQAKNIGWKIDCDIGAQVISVHADESKLKQVLINLIGNALKFTDKGGVILNVSKLDNDKFYFEVIDTGLGIEKASQNNIFEKFQQEEGGLVKGGTGLGLSISKTQIEVMGGSLEVDSEPGKGSKFYFTLAIPPAKTDLSHTDEGLKCLPENVRVNALVVDDIQGNRDVLSQLLKLIGVDTIEAQDGESAIVLANEFKPDIVFMDYHMQGMNGLQALSEIRKMLGDTFKAVVVTAHAFDHDVRAFQSSDVSLVIRKPFKEEEIVKCISDLMSVELISIESTKDDTSDKFPDDIDFNVDGIPEVLMDRLYKAVEYSEITDIENIASQISESGEEYKAFADRLLLLANNFDTVSLQTIVNNINENR